jgi:hypothetical protein
MNRINGCAETPRAAIGQLSRMPRRSRRRRRADLRPARARARTDEHVPWARTSGLPRGAHHGCRQTAPTGVAGEGLRIGSREAWKDLVAGVVTVRQRGE